MNARSEPSPRGGCHVERAQRAVDDGALARGSAAILEMFAMGCPSCAMRVRNGLLRLPGVVRAVVSHEQGRAWVDFDPEVRVPQQLVDAVVPMEVESRPAYNAVVEDVFA